MTRKKLKIEAYASREPIVNNLLTELKDNYAIANFYERGRPSLNGFSILQRERIERYVAAEKIKLINKALNCEIN